MSDSGEKKFWQTEEFRKLQDKWYGKLAKDGFEELEYFDHNNEPNTFMRRGATADLARQYTPDAARYYELAQQYYWAVRWSRWPAKYRTIWRMHSYGHTDDDVSKYLEKLGVKITRQEVRRRLNKMKSGFEAWRKRTVPKELKERDE